MPHFTSIPATFAIAMLVVALPASAQPFSEPQDLTTAESDPTAALALPALIRERASPSRIDAISQNGAPADQDSEKAILSCRKTGGDGTPPTQTPAPEAGSGLTKSGAGTLTRAQPDEQTAAARMQSSNNLKQMGLASKSCG